MTSRYLLLYYTLLTCITGQEIMNFGQECVTVNGFLTDENTEDIVIVG